MTNSLPAWLQRARDQWTYRGQTRPDFAAPVRDDQESVWDYPRPPRIDKDTRHIVVKHASLVVADTRRAIRILETASPPTFYLPPADLNMEFLRGADGDSLCEWKGVATYLTLEHGGSSRPRAAEARSSDHIRIPHVAWKYDEPFEEFASIAGMVAFYPGKIECYVDSIRVVPQPGGLYGGWVTPEVAGPFKGGPNSSHW